MNSGWCPLLTATSRKCWALTAKPWPAPRRAWLSPGETWGWVRWLKERRSCGQQLGVKRGTRRKPLTHTSKYR